MRQRIAQHGALSPEAHAALAWLPAELRTLRPHAYLIREGRRPASCSMLLSGVACRHKLTGDGARQIVGIYLKGDFVDAQNLFLDRSDHNIQAISDCEVLDVPIDAMRRLVADQPEIARALWSETLVEAAMMREWLLNLGRRDAAVRVIHLLCELAVRLQHLGLAGHDNFQLPLTQAQLADAVGLTAVHVNRVLRQLELRGLIARDHRCVRVMDWQALRQAGDFSPAYLHLGETRAAAARGARIARAYADG
ncbi:Crp/Fnr family transcriptional regulator [Sphingomonas gilva]|uniref:Crp/Fnr family transcriptional regulator n=2 Tax=Sphingomonas gilva TaxID=2305907 RepID=A0A396RTQ9_9SPHN|nr:Crp/Fnr family transcriptional regulator [Sphingomonas gilva]